MKRLIGFCLALTFLVGAATLLVNEARAQRGGFGYGGGPTHDFIQSLGGYFLLDPANTDLTVIAGVDRSVMTDGKTYLSGYAGYGSPRNPARGGRGGRGGRRGARGTTATLAMAQTPTPTPTPLPSGPPITVAWSKASGPGAVTFDDPTSIVSTAKFSKAGTYALKLTASNGQKSVSSTLTTKVVEPPPVDRLDVVYTKNYSIDNPLWNQRVKALIVHWIPNCIDYINTPDLGNGGGGIDNFVSAAHALKGEPYTPHRGYVFSNAWVHQTVESMCEALMVDAKGDPEILAAQDKFRATLDDWIPKILAAQEPDGYLQTAFTARPENSRWTERWSPANRGNHEGYVSGYFLESAINHYTMTGGKDLRLYNAAKKLADCWYNNIGPAPKKPWYDGHEEMEQALVRFGRFVNDMEGGGKGDRYIELGKFLLDCRWNASTPQERLNDDKGYDQHFAPVIKQYEALGHAVRAAYTYSAMADVAAETHDIDYQSAVLSIWDNMSNKKLYITGGTGGGENMAGEGFAGNYSLPNNSYAESCANCGDLFFHWKMMLASHDAKYADFMEEVMYNGIMGALDLPGYNLCYTNLLSGGNNRLPWQGCPCCVGNVPRTMLMIPTWTYAKGKDALYVNMFIGSTINVEKVAGTDIQMVQKTDYPWNGKVSITVNPKQSKRLSIMVRVPNRSTSELYKLTPEVSGLKSLKVNGTAIKPKIEKGYAVITRTWKAGDKIDFELPMQVQVAKADERVEVLNGRVALKYGPLVYNVERVDNGDLSTKKLGPEPKLTAEWRPDLLEGVMTIKGQWTDGSPMLAIPNYARVNREVGAGEHTPPPPPGTRGGRRGGGGFGGGFGAANGPTSGTLAGRRGGRGFGAATGATSGTLAGARRGGGRGGNGMNVASTVWFQD